ncbi:50S ribosomal protein L33 [Bacillus fonticola]|nr:50S ribosomal protein L33 [Bacillus fonticola]
MRKKVTLACSDCGSRNYSTEQRRDATERLEIKKYCKTCSAHTMHRTTK